MSLEAENGKSMIDMLKPKVMNSSNNVFKNMDEDFVDLLKKMLQFNPSKRMTMNELMEHRLVKSFRKIE